MSIGRQLTHITSSNRGHPKVTGEPQSRSEDRAIGVFQLKDRAIGVLQLKRRLQNGPTGAIAEHVHCELVRHEGEDAVAHVRPPNLQKRTRCCTKYLVPVVRISWLRGVFGKRCHFSDAFPVLGFAFQGPMRV